MAPAERPAVVESYIVRIYRRNPRQRGTLQGVVEDVQSHTRRAFRTVGELADLLRMDPPLPVAQASRRAGARHPLKS